ncbi:DUF423 domain-containing protein [Lysinibacillus sp. NPDC097287]|uniref:DUF423 domain-containing protein n=1 Tax=Lysinibacillus sp. NPDC097287 TaxID=3364144 RepID=UPI0038169ACB
MQTLIFLGAIMACLGVALGAFGAHALKDKFTEPRYAAIWETAVQYHMYHSLGLLGLGILSSDALLGASNMLSWAGYLMFAGIIFFSGSLYILAVTGVKKFGAITPIGGLLFIIAWVLVALSTIA